MWYLLAEESAARLLERIEKGKQNSRQTLSAEQIAEAVDRAAQRSQKQPRKKSEEPQSVRMAHSSTSHR